MPWFLPDQKQSGELSSLEALDHTPEFGRRMSWLWAARRAFESVDTSHWLRGALLACVRSNAHTQRLVNGDLVYVRREVKRKKTNVRTVLETHRWHGPAIVVGRE